MSLWNEGILLLHAVVANHFGLRKLMKIYAVNRRLTEDAVKDRPQSKIQKGQPRRERRMSEGLFYPVSHMSATSHLLPSAALPTRPLWYQH